MSHIEDCFEGVVFPSLDLGMSLPAFGLTFYIVIDLLRHIVQNNKDALTNANIINHTNQLLEKASALRI
jgi:hypothetical protein